MGAHFVMKCECGRVIAQCRCPDPAKQVRVSPAPCEECLEKVRDEVARMSGNDVAADL